MQFLSLFRFILKLYKFYFCQFEYWESKDQRHGVICSNQKYFMVESFIIYWEKKKKVSIWCVSWEECVLARVASIANCVLSMLFYAWKQDLSNHSFFFFFPVRKRINCQLISSFLWDLPVYPKMQNNKSYLVCHFGCHIYTACSPQPIQRPILICINHSFLCLITEQKNIQFQMLKWGTFY